MSHIGACLVWGLRDQFESFSGATPLCSCLTSYLTAGGNEFHLFQLSLTEGTIIVWESDFLVGADGTHLPILNMLALKEEKDPGLFLLL